MRRLCPTLPTYAGLALPIGHHETISAAHMHTYVHVCMHAVSGGAQHGKVQGHCASWLRALTLDLHLKKGACMLAVGSGAAACLVTPPLLHRCSSRPRRSRMERSRLVATACPLSPQAAVTRGRR